ncbi:MAG: L-serine ammonia-lyase, iron-sulfur-dependent, subunit alpha [Deltaproteobacteria bacterium]|jgi:L-cysteine desulfidase|nr:L-serine ammonia-lyase, iron-sulfur-dependent, subunit alpha [Deltaproteobacteria bacterium]
MDLTLFFRNEVKPAMGCTEPGAVAYAAATAARLLQGKVQRLEMDLSLGMFKNGRDVGIPGSGGLRGSRLAAAMGALAGNPEKGLMALEGLPPDIAQEASHMVQTGKVNERVVDNVPPVYAGITVYAEDGAATAVISGRHDRISRITHNGSLLFEAEALTDLEPVLPDYLLELKKMGFEDIWELASRIDEATEKYLLEGAAMNMALARRGLEMGWGIGVGQSIAAHSSGDLGALVRCMTGAAADMRMAGEPYPAMSSAGSGNQGITATVPLAVVAEARGISPRALAEALALSHLITGYLKAYAGSLSAICGCAVSAGVGASAGLVRLAGGTALQAERASATLLASLMGMICDGAKNACCLKVAVAAGEAYDAGCMGLDDKGVQHPAGVVSPRLSVSARALGRISKALSAADKTMVSIMLEQEEHAADAP